MKILQGVGYFFITMGIYLGIPLTGWGLNDINGFFKLAPRLVYGLVVALVGVGIAWQSYSAPEGFRGGKGRKDDLVFRQQVVKRLVIVMLYAALVGLPLLDRRGIASISTLMIYRWIGVILFSMGIGLVFWSGLALGKLYSADVTLQDNHKLITDGPYKLIRHPRYSGGILLGFGLGLVFNTWIGVIGSLIFIPIILFRIKDEEILMEEAFSENWQEYYQKTKRLIPFIY